MSPVVVVLSAVFIYNVVFVVFLAPYPVWGHTRSTWGPIGIGLGIAIVAAVVATVFALIYRFLLVPLNAVVLRTLILTLLVVVSAMSTERIGAFLFPYRVDAIRKLVPLAFANAAVFVVAMALAESRSIPLELIPLAGFSAGLGIVVALLPVAAIRRRSRRFKLLDAVRGEAFLWFAGAVVSLAFLYVNEVFGSSVPSLW